MKIWAEALVGGDSHAKSSLLHVKKRLNIFVRRHQFHSLKLSVTKVFQQVSRSEKDLNQLLVSDTFIAKFVKLKTIADKLKVWVSSTS